MFPDVVSAAKELNVSSAVFDAEVIGYNEDAGEFMPFQETMKRKRKYGVTGASERIPVKAFVFDVIHLNGRSLLGQSNESRLDEMTRVIGKEGIILQSSSHIVSSANELQKLFEEYVSEGLEGVIIKDNVGNLYIEKEPGQRIWDSGQL